MHDFLLAEEVIPTLIEDHTNNLLTMVSSSEEEIKVVVFSLNSDGSPDPDGFGACFFHTYWEIVQKEVIDVVLKFFHTSWLLPNYNANSLILIPIWILLNSINP